MEVTEVSAEGLERKFNCESSGRVSWMKNLSAKLEEIKAEVHLKGLS